MRYIVAIAAILLSATAAQARWTYAGQDIDGMVVTIDRAETIVHVDWNGAETYRDVWVKYQTPGKTARTVENARVWCSTRRLATISVVRYGENNKVISSETTPDVLIKSNAQAAAPDTIGWDIVKAACK